MDGERSNGVRDNDDELVLVFPASELRRGCYFSGYSTDTSCLDVLLQAAKWMPRDAVESDSRVKQLIPYTLVRHEGRYLSYRRANLGQEQRLWGWHSIGVGGHVTLVDEQSGLSAPTRDMIRNAAERELREEIHVSLVAGLCFIGLLNDDSHSAGAVHFGMVYLADASGPDVRPREPGLMVDICYIDCGTLRSRVRLYEPWSQLLINALPLT